LYLLSCQDFHHLVLDQISYLQLNMVKSTLLYTV
jgi:hypothetical protein